MKLVVLVYLHVIVYLTGIYCDYDCVCNYAVEKSVYPDAAQTKKPIGYLYEFDCKPEGTDPALSAQQNVLVIQYEKQLAYVSPEDTQRQICAGNTPDVDKIPPPTTTSTSTTTIKYTTTRTTTKTTMSTTKPSTTTPTTTTMSTTTPTSTTMSTTTPTTTMSTTTPTTTTMSTTTPTTTTMSTTTPTTTMPTTTTPRTTTSIPTTTLPSTVAPTTQYAYWLMAANVTRTPYQYVGIGYNILYSNPDSSQDPGFYTTRHVFQLTGDPRSTIQEAVYHTNASCSASTQSFLIYGSKAYQDELMNYVSLDNHTSSLTNAAFTYNMDFKQRQSIVNDIEHVYNDVITTCKFGSVQYINRNNNNTVSRDFADSVCHLPTDYSNGKQEYMDFLDKWGTSIVTSVEMGTRTTARYRTTPMDLFQHVLNLDPDYIKNGGVYSPYESSVAIDTKHYTSSRAARSVFGTKTMVSIGTKVDQIPISSHSIPISTALDTKYWKPILDELVLEGVCSDSLYGNGLMQYKNNMDTALNQYAAYKTIQPGVSQAMLLDRQYVKVPLTWPVGTYGLMKSVAGCPSGHTLWHDGWRKFDTEDSGAHNYFSSNVYNSLSGSFASNNILTRFCMKIIRTTSKYDQQWPKGSFCLLKNGQCPAGFATGFIFWDDEDSNTNNGNGGAMPDGSYDSNTKIYFCCRNDGSPHDKIFLPMDKPFILVRYSNICQAVHGMSVTEVYVRWDDEDTLNSSGRGGMYPADSGGSKDHLLHFCYYKSSGAGIGPSLVG